MGKPLLNSDLARHISPPIEATRLEATLTCPKTHKEHPLGRLLRAQVNGSRGAASQVAANTAEAVHQIRRTVNASNLGPWLDKRLRDAASTRLSFAEITGSLGEIRAAGALLRAGFSVAHVPEGKNKTPDFQVTKTSSIFVEVATKEMNGDESDRLRSWLNTPPGQRSTMHGYMPGGRPKPGETVTENVASKFADWTKKEGQVQQGFCNLLWIDLQDEDWFGVDSEHATPLICEKGYLWSGPLWLAFYGERNDPILDMASPEAERAYVTGKPRVMSFAGMFAQGTGYSGVLLALPNAVLCFENPDPGTTTIPNDVYPGLMHLPGFCLDRSNLAWPEVNNQHKDPKMYLKDRVGRQRVEIARIAQHSSHAP